jgi:hypothetical protein
VYVAPEPSKAGKGDFESVNRLRYKIEEIMAQNLTNDCRQITQGWGSEESNGKVREVCQQDNYYSPSRN